MERVSGQRGGADDATCLPVPAPPPRLRALPQELEETEGGRAAVTKSTSERKRRDERAREQKFAELGMLRTTQGVARTGPRRTLLLEWDIVEQPGAGEF